MATHAGRLAQDQNLNIHFNGSLVGGKNNGSKAQKKGGGLAGRKALNDISNSGKPSALQPSRKHNSLNVISIGEDLDVPKKASAKTSVKAHVGGRKALGDLTNSGKPSGQKVLKKEQDKKLRAVAEEEKFPNSIADERFLHNHQECIKSQRNAFDRDYFMKTVGLDDDVLSSAPWSSCEAQDDSPVMVFEMEELPELMTEDGTRQRSKKLDPVFGSPKAPYMQLKDYDLPNFILMESPKVISLGEDLGVPNKRSAKTSVKAHVSGRKVLGDLTNSGKPSGQNVLKKKDQDKKLLAIAEEEKFPANIADERFLHNHQECIKSQRNALDRDYFMKTIGLDDDVLYFAPWPSCEGQDYPDSPVKKVFEMEEELPELMIGDGTCQCDKKLDSVFGSPNFSDMQLKDFDLPNFLLMESP